MDMQVEYCLSGAFSDIDADLETVGSIFGDKIAFCGAQELVNRVQFFFIGVKNSLDFLSA